MDVTQIPKGLGIDTAKWMHYLSALGVAFINPYDEGWIFQAGKEVDHLILMDLPLGILLWVMLSLNIFNY